MYFCNSSLEYGEEEETLFCILDDVEAYYIDYGVGESNKDPYGNMIRNADFSSGTKIGDYLPWLMERQLLV